MYPASRKYVKVSSGDSEGSEPFSLRNSSRASSRRPILNFICAILFFFASNAVTWYMSSTYHKKHVSFRTPYAGLERDTISIIDGHDPYTDVNDTLRDQLWLDINVDDGMVALPDEYVEKMGLPVSQRFPWDESKGIYLLQAHHNLHCARSVYISLMEYRKDIPQTRSHHHIIHCLDALRRDVICNADDIPRFTTPDPVPETGHGQLRQCRNWDKLNDWAKEHNACYRYIHEQSGNFPEIERFVWCPEGSPYRKEVDKYFVVDYDMERGTGVV
ncbi:hypothetical protein BofuT4_P080870.1 [Botrytis cinerea T4]|uniref:Tat pathway signal sequence protein n=1 Tax=Botryotinia fuckeliana (strain T4) TaxID=999810 RepID=G2YKZ4_BOTF4|nr:hypothetical protein BofuT4_P080870.1 [Botrytis cinerea T4]